MARAPTLGLREQNRATLARQMLLARHEKPASFAIERLVGLQAQLPKPPFVGLWTRLAPFRREALVKLAHDRAVVRATMMRGTLHLASARDYLRLRSVLQPALTRGMQSIVKTRDATLDVDRVAARARAFFAETPRTFDEVRDDLVRAFPKNEERAMGYAVRMSLPLVLVPADATWAYTTPPRFALADEWLHGALDPPSPASLRELVRRYLAAFGPASATDAQAWSGLVALRDVVESLRPELVVFRDDRGKELFDLPDAPRPGGDADAPVRFLPEFDDVIVSRKDERFVRAAHRKQVFLPGLRIAATFLVDGFVAGTWSVVRKRSTATLTIAPLVALPKKTLADLGAEAEKLVRFVEEDARDHEVKVEGAR